MPFLFASYSRRLLFFDQERVVPEYSFLEPRGMGIFDGEEVASVLPTVG